MAQYNSKYYGETNG